MRSELRVEDRTGLRRTPGSGCGMLFKGDNGNTMWHYEDKSTRSGRLCIKLSWLEKAKKQAEDTNKIFYALGISGSIRFVVLSDFHLSDVFDLEGYSEDTLAAIQHRSVTKDAGYWGSLLTACSPNQFIKLGFFNAGTGWTEKYGIVSEDIFIQLVKRSEGMPD